MGMTLDGLSYWQAESEDTELLALTIGDLLDRRAAELPAKEAIVYTCYPEYGKALDFRWTYQEYRQRADDLARGLLSLGLQKGEHIAVWAPNVPEWLLLQMAAAKTGLVLVTINPAYRASELEYVLKQGDVAALFFLSRIRDYDCIAAVTSMITPGSQPGEVSSAQLPRLRYTCLVGLNPPEIANTTGWRPALYSELIAAGQSITPEAQRQRQATVEPHDRAMIQYTSGTTGFPKGAMLTHYGILNNALVYWKRLGTLDTDRGCMVMPYFHVGGCVLATLGSLCFGMTMCPLLAFEPLRTMQLISQERCTTLGGVPTMLLAILQHPDFEKYDLTSLRLVISGAASVPIYLMEQVKERIGADVAIVFGQTEASAGITLTLPDDSFELKSSTVGKPMPHIDIKIIDPATGQPVSVGERGELCCRGFLVMEGYYNMPEKTAETIDSQGWLHSGDLATMDKDGYVQIVGRLKDMIIRGGENIYPRQIEEFLIRHPKVADVQVIGVPDKFFGEELLALVIPKSGTELTKEELRDYCKNQISHQKIPRYFRFVEAYPMTASGKVQKYLLRQQAIQGLGLEDVDNKQQV